MSNLTKDISKKDVIAFNQQFDKGYFENESSLDFALSYFKQNISWTKKVAYLARAILIDHVFQEANKRTTAALLIYYADYNNYEFEEKKLVNMIKRILMKNITSIKRIQMMIEDGITKKDR